MIVLKYTKIHIYCQQQRRRPRSVVSGDITLMPIFVGFAGEMVSNESGVVENASFSPSIAIYLPYEVPHWLYISKFTRLRAVSRRQHGSCI